MYLEIWNERIHYCEVSFRYLGNEALTTMFHHILPKAKYPQYRYCKANIIVVHPDIHNNIESGKDYSILKDREKVLLDLHQKGKLS